MSKRKVMRSNNMHKALDRIQTELWEIAQVRPNRAPGFESRLDAVIINEAMRNITHGLVLLRSAWWMGASEKLSESK